MKLSDYLITQQITPAEFARRIGVGRMSVHRYIRGERFPRPDVLQRIHQATEGQVTPNDFLILSPTPGSIPDDNTAQVIGHNCAAFEVSNTQRSATDQSPSSAATFGCSDDEDLIGRTLYPWSRLTADEQQVLDDAYADMMDEPPEGSGLSPIVQQALETLGERANYHNDQFTLDGQVSRITSLIEAANDLRRKQGLPLLRYPGVKT